MFRRVVPTVARQAGTRSFFYPGGGETGIWASSMKRAWDVTQVAVVVCSLVCACGLPAAHQAPVHDETTDLERRWHCDGRGCRQPEDPARIMPYMNQIQEKLEAAGSQ